MKNEEAIKEAFTEIAENLNRLDTGIRRCYLTWMKIEQLNKEQLDAISKRAETFEEFNNVLMR